MSVAGGLWGRFLGHGKGAPKEARGGRPIPCRPEPRIDPLAVVSKGALQLAPSSLHLYLRLSTSRRPTSGLRSLPGAGDAVARLTKGPSALAHRSPLQA